MKTKKMPVNELRHPDENVRMHSESQIYEFAKSLKKFGQIRPAVIDECNVVLAGNGLLAASKLIGWEYIDVIVVNNLTDYDKKKLMLVDNKIFSMGADNYDIQRKFLLEFAGNNDFDVPGFDEETLKRLSSSFSQTEKNILSYGLSDQPIITSNNPTDEKDNFIVDQDKKQEYLVCPNCGEGFCR